MISVLYIFNQKSLERVLFGSPFRTIWIIFFSLFTGFWLIPLAQADTPYKVFASFQMIALFSTGIIFFANPPIREEKPIEIKTVEKIIDHQVFVESPVAELSQPAKVMRERYGIIYVMRRSDGVLKLGKTYNLRTRIGQHRSTYRTHFVMVASWVVPQVDRYEHLALDMTKRYAHSEGSRRELRQMSESELSNFILDFTNKVQNGFQKTAQN